MERLKRYCIDIKEINGIETYIISPKLLDDVFSDLELLDSLFVSYENKLIQHLIHEAKSSPLRIFVAFTKHSNIKIEKLVWQPVNCYKDGDDYHHVFICDSWICLECKHINHDKFIMPIVEHDAIFYAGTDNQFPPICSVFKRKKCINCEKLLQNHYLYTKE